MMEYVLLAAFGIGLLLFILSWLRVIFAGFGHHFVTGLVSVVPVLNLLILPGIWHKVYGWILAGIIGLLVAIGAWFAGAEQHVYRYTSGEGFSSSVMSQGGGNPDSVTGTLTEETAAAPLPPGKELPRDALYRLDYQKVEANRLGSHVGRYARVTRSNRRTFEGKIISAHDKGIKLEMRSNGGIIERNIDLDDIISAEVMSKQ